MIRATRRWEAMIQKAVCEGSEAQKLHCIADARNDIITLADALERIANAKHAPPDLVEIARFALAEH